MKWLNFEPVDKSIMFLKDRIDFTTTGLIKQFLSFNWERCPNTKRQYNLIQWLSKTKIDNANNEPKMLDLHDDTWDSDCYALMNDMKWLIEKINNELLINKNKFNFLNKEW